MEAVRRFAPRARVVFTGTRGQYGPAIRLPVDEEAPTNPKGLYEISNLTAEKIVAQLIQQGLAPQTARRCVDLFDEVEWRNARLPLRQWLERIRDFYHRSRLVQKPSPPKLRSAAPAAA